MENEVPSQSGERKGGRGGMEGQSSVCVRVIFQGRAIFPETLEEKRS